MYWSVLCYHPYLVSMLFADLLSLHLVTFLMFFILVHVTFFSSRCMLELKFVIYYRAACPPSQASYAVLAGESQAFFKHSPLTNSIPNSAILRNNYISLLKVQSSKFKVICVHAYTWRKNGVVKEAIVLQWAARIASCDFKPGKKRWTGALLSEKCCCFVRKPSWKIHANLN